MLIDGDGGLRRVAAGIAAPACERVALLRHAGEGDLRSRRVMILQRVEHNASRAGGGPVDDVMHRHACRQTGGRAEAVGELDRVLAGVGLYRLLERQRVARGAVDRHAVEVPLVV